MLIKSERKINPLFPFFFSSLTNLHRKDSSTYDVYKNSVDDLLDLHMAGFNVCLLVLGESESGKTYTVQGESTHNAGLVPLILDYLFSKLAGGEYSLDTCTCRYDFIYLSYRGIQ